MLLPNWRGAVKLAASVCLVCPLGCSDSASSGAGGSGGGGAGSSEASAGGGMGGSGNNSSGTAMPLPTCAMIAEAVPGASTCREEPARCSLTVPTSASCTAACEAMGTSCLRAYPQTSDCVPAVELGSLACDATPISPAFCQCGDPAATHPEMAIVTIGDSTMANQYQPGIESGWGDELPPFAVRPEDIHNQGSSGASSLDFETRQSWLDAQALLGPNVYLLIQFGHNDTSTDPERHTDPGVPPDYLGTYRDRLMFYVDAAEKAGATPVLLTSLGNMDFNADGTSQDSYMNDYVLAARKLAADEGLPLIDANRVSRAEYDRLGPVDTIALYSNDETTHFSPAGATRMAELIVRAGCVESETLCAQFLPLP